MNKYFIGALAWGIFNFLPIHADAIFDYRYAALKPLLKKYTRPFTMLELWAGNAEISLQAAQKFNAVCVIAEESNGGEIYKRLQADHAENIILLKRNLSINELESLGECEHIDVVIVPDISGRFEMLWKKAIDAILTIGDFVCIQAPCKSDPLHSAMTAYLLEKGGKVIATPDKKLSKEIGELYLFTMNKKYIIKRRWNYAKQCNIGEYTIESNFTDKRLIKQKKKPASHSITSWNAGINLLTYKKLHGIYPTYDAIHAMLLPLGNIKHNDLRIFNIILQGKKVVPIDCDEPERRNTAKHLLPMLLNHFKTKKLPNDMQQTNQHNDALAEIYAIAV
jgi:hypothetical protein